MPKDDLNSFAEYIMLSRVRTVRWIPLRMSRERCCSYFVRLWNEINIGILGILYFKAWFRVHCVITSQVNVPLSAPFLSMYFVNKSCLFDRIFDLHDASRLCCAVGDAATGVCRGDPWSRPTEGSSF